MVTKKQIRSANKLKNAKKQKPKYPLLLQKVLDTSDIILEILDARFAKEMQNKEVEQFVKSKKKKIIYVLNKADLTKKRDQKLNPRIFVSCKNRKGINELRNKIKQEAGKIRKTGEYERIQVGVIGYPNTGKSSLINLLIGRSSAKIGAEAGFTKGIQKLRLTENIQLLDSPGVIPAGDYSMTNEKKIALHAKVGGRSPNQIKNPEITLNEIMKTEKKSFEKFYKIKFKNAEDLIEKIGRKKSFLKKGGEVNSDQSARFILKDLQLGNVKV
ncbi:MAG: 50S ribosome-binding GTPase [Nanoarchaeota archaeon]|nr:50S ribosome-binding GTPase [Nanoarchaeota archaeon]